MKAEELALIYFIGQYCLCVPAQGLTALRGKEWVAGIAEGISVKVSVGDIRVEHQVKLEDFTRWLQKPGGLSPREVSERQRIRSILGMPVSR